ncbi:Uncharacterised protein [Mycobacteroides abscessus subsp. bolletii]|nr:Uncharacterised protein [Mycobacteroides abscessus subsp. bolletii]SLD37328.1 Uncharacterised protein [Mycobacteroides abscessus subsp. bolletii]
MKTATKHLVYLVHWPEIHVMKAGCTSRKRWRKFVIRGAELVDLIEFDDCSDALDLESLALRGLSAHGPLAFGSAKESEPYLGRGGGGWRECYRIPEGIQPMELLMSTDWSSV